MSFSRSDLDYMTQALHEARRGLHTTDPNPRVGCVLVNDGKVVGRGWHQTSGGAHAEVLALQQAGSRAAGSHAYVTLEPCCHHGKTGPCTTALIEAGVSQVTYALRDPDPRVAGQGHQALSDAGINVRYGLLEQPAAELNVGFISRHLHGRPWVRLKLAVSLDGRVAASDGSSSWITGEAARADVQYWRARASVILTGSGTVNWDNPQLNVRLQERGIRQPLRVVLSSSFTVDPAARVFADPETAMVIGCIDGPGKQALRQAGINTRMVAVDESGLDLSVVMSELAGLPANEVHVECGPALAGNLLEAGLVDELLIYQADCLLGDQGLPMMKLPQLKSISDAQRLSPAELHQFGNDRRLRYILTDTD